MENIVILDPSDKPFGMLRNDFKYPLVIDEKEWASVDNYVYGNLLSSKTILNNVLENENPRNVRKVYTSLLSKLEEEVFSSGIRVGLDAKIKADQYFKDVLMKTDGTILYVSPNNILGIRKERGKEVGKNMYGEWLQQVRTELLKQHYIFQKNAGPDDDLVFDHYLAEKGLLYALQYENLDRYLSGASLQEIVRQLVQTYGKNKIFIVNKDTALTIQKHRNIEPYYDSKNLVRFVRKTNIRAVFNKNLSKRRFEVFKQFTYQVMDQDYPHNQLNKAQIFNDELAKLKFSTKERLIEDTFKLFHEGKVQVPLPETNNLFFPSPDEIRMYEEDIVPVPGFQPAAPAVIDRVDYGFTFVYAGRNDPLYRVGGKTIQHSENDILSILNDSTVLTIEGLTYPSISHYLVVRLAQLIPEREHISEAYKLIINPTDGLFFPIKTAEQNYRKEKDNYNGKKMALLKNAISVKFQDELFKDVLLATLDNSIEFSVQPVEEDVVSKHEIEAVRASMAIYENDSYIKYWFIEKIKDICYIGKCVQLLKRHYQQDVVLTTNFFKKILSTFFGTCGGSKKIIPSYPSYIDLVVSKFFLITPTASNLSVTKNTIIAIFSFLDFILSNLNKFLISQHDFQNKSKQYKLLIYNVINCAWLLQNFKKDNLFEVNNGPADTVSAMVNVLFKLHKLLDLGNQVTKFDIKIAYSILSGKIINLTDNKTSEKDLLLDRVLGEIQANDSDIRVNTATNRTTRGLKTKVVSNSSNSNFSNSDSSSLGTQLCSDGLCSGGKSTVKNVKSKSIISTSSSSGSSKGSELFVDDHANDENLGGYDPVVRNLDLELFGENSISTGSSSGRSSVYDFQNSDDEDDFVGAFYEAQPKNLDVIFKENNKSISDDNKRLLLSYSRFLQQNNKKNAINARIQFFR